MNAASLGTWRESVGFSGASAAACAVRAESAVGASRQRLINRDLGLDLSENPSQGSFVVDELTDLVEEAVYKEFEAISERGDVLGAMDTMFQRGKIQEECLYYESKKHDGSLPLIGVNTFLPKEHAGDITTTIELIRSMEGEKNQQIANVEAFRANRNARAALAPAASIPANDSNLSPTGRGRAEGAGEGGLAVDGTNTATPTNETAAHGIKTRSGDPKVPGTLNHLQSTARARANLFEALLEVVKHNSHGQISHARYDVGGEYRRNM